MESLCALNHVIIDILILINLCASGLTIKQKPSSAHSRKYFLDLYISYTFVFTNKYSFIVPLFCVTETLFRCGTACQWNTQTTKAKDTKSSVCHLHFRNKSNLKLHEEQQHGRERQSIMCIDVQNGISVTPKDEHHWQVNHPYAEACCSLFATCWA